MEHSTDFIVNPNIDEIKDCKPKWDDNSVFLHCPVTLIFGQTTAGKTIMLQNLLFRILLAKYDLKNIYTFSSTVLKDKTWEPFLKKMDQRDPNLLESNIHTKMEGLPPLIKKLGNQELLGESEPTLIIIDDMTGNKELSNHQSSLSNFCTQARHDKCAIIILCHKFKRISNTIRSSCKQMLIGYSTESMNPVFDEIAAIYPKKAMNRMFEKEVFGEKRKFNFLVIRKDLDLKEGMYRKNFTKILDPADYLY